MRFITSLWGRGGGNGNKVANMNTENSEAKYNSKYISFPESSIFRIIIDFQG